MKAIFLACIIALTTTTAFAQVAQAPATVPTADDLPVSGEIDGAYVLDVVIMTKSDIGPFTRFLIQVSDDPTKQYWFYVRNDDNTKALVRGAIIGLLMGAAETYRFPRERSHSYINFTYSTVKSHREIETASLESKILH
jgi:hypothetical protein